ncbi:diguanylate cyclase [Cytobacillus sp. Hz8]|uniref:sensor domain-containing diguanylate cyclase n=1 Tax=Cytobacillus sp. Hz8 TaxID=3347168 RepID=UPI0035E01217
MHEKRGIKFQIAISLLVILTVISTILVSWFTARSALKEALAKEYMDSNYEYAKKLSISTTDLLEDMEQNLNAVGRIAGFQEFTNKDLDNWKFANSDYFNSIFITDPHGVIQLISPMLVQFNGKQVRAGMKIRSTTIKKALKIKKPFISQPYRATSGQLIILISTPIFDEQGNYKGIIGGTIYLESENILKRILNNHVYGNGSYVYVVDHSGRIIFHPNPERIHELVSDNKVVQQLMKGKSGATEVVYSDGKKYFSGYAIEKKLGLGIVTQTPVDVIKVPLQDLLKKMTAQLLPLLLIILLVAGFLANNLSRPLNTLAKYSEDAINQKKMVSLQALHTDSNIYEVRQLYHQFKNHMEILNSQIQLDGLTGIANRKTFDVVLEDWNEQGINFSIIFLDIDHFKKVNDQYGHLVGDEVLKYLAVMMKDVSRDEDLCFRYGGEEFGILIREMNEKQAFQIAERLRLSVAETPSPTGNAITISLGISTRQREDFHPKAVIEKADAALYASKANGRNQTTIYQDSMKNKAL